MNKGFVLVGFAVRFSILCFGFIICSNTHSKKQQAKNGSVLSVFLLFFLLLSFLLHLFLLRIISFSFLLQFSGHSGK